MCDSCISYKCAHAYTPSRIRFRLVFLCYFTNEACTYGASPPTMTVCIMHNPTIMQGFSVCLFAHSSFSSHTIGIKLSNPSQQHPWSVPRFLAFSFRSNFQNLNGTVLSTILETFTHNTVPIDAHKAGNSA